MCGINGVFNFSGKEISFPERLIQGMNEAIRHRGPDDSGIWSDDKQGVYLGHRRLSILDLSQRGHQPMIGPKGTAIVFNGEIYNYRDIRKRLSHIDFHSDTDTEVLLHLYESTGSRMLDELNGMFAFAFWDSSERKLFLARDRVGKKPLYYTTMNGIFAFSSEIKALLTLPWVRASLDEDALYHFLTFSKVSPPQTMFKGIHKFHPGYMMVVSGEGIQSYEPYWEPSYSDYSDLSSDRLQTLILEQLRKSVEYRMVSDVPVGAFLSGGVDSSAIVALMSKLTPHPVKTYSIGFDGFQNNVKFDERNYARMVSKQFGTEHHERIVTREEITRFLPQIVNIYDEPLADATSIPIYFISQMARENGTIVVLTGDGSDELFCGYDNWLPYARLYPFYRLISRSPASVRALFSTARTMFDEQSRLYEIISRASKGQEFFWGGASAIKESAKHAILSDGFKRRMASHDLASHLVQYREQFERVTGGRRDKSYVDWMVYIGLKDIIPNFYLYRADRLGMANSVEIRVPFLDYNLVNMAISIPGHWKIKGGEPKYILKKSLEPILPKEVLYRKKVGFCVPLEEWMKEIIVEHVQDRFSQFCDETDIFNKNSVAQLLDRCRRGDASVVHSLWNIYFLITWHERWFRQPIPETRAH
jgi:asparagine synthase (glutamine-hydrolysing)